MTTHSYTPAEMSPLSDVIDIGKRATLHGYTGIAILYCNDADGEFFKVTIAEADDKTTTKTNLDAAVVPTLSLDTTDLQVTGDGVATGTITVTDSRGAGGSGETVTVHPPPTEIMLSPLSIVLDGSGQGVLTFGPSASAGVVSGKMEVCFVHAVAQGSFVVSAEVSYV